MKKIWTFILLIVIILVLCSGCSKNTVISLYDNVTKTIGDLCLTNDILLQGKRKFGIDHYVGSYDVVYKNSSSREVLFGGTTIERKNGSTINVKIDVDSIKGDIKVIMVSGIKKNVIADDTGTYEFDINVKDGSNYLIIKTNNYSGSVKVNID